MKSVIPLLLFILGIAGIYVGTVQAAFTALMRLSQRLSAERSDPNDALTRYLDEPRLLFIPARILLVAGRRAGPALRVATPATPMGP